ncbi:hypothetical protein [[Mycoplasma] imitans]|uniref:hypothetical protein n=1 Tax=[Mycoplasma] imitans TaxID=29560 RepID=UPI00048A0B48|nr:hypothetical protein [[Mycoplasma] imitans]
MGALLGGAITALLLFKTKIPRGAFIALMVVVVVVGTADLIAFTILSFYGVSFVNGTNMKNTKGLYISFIISFIFMFLVWGQLVLIIVSFKTKNAMIDWEQELEKKIEQFKHQTVSIKNK